MFFTLAVSADTAARCAVLAGAALGTDPHAAWALATLAALLSGDWLSAREPAARTAGHGRA